MSYHGISLIRNILNDAGEAYKYLVDRGKSKLFAVDTDQIFIF